VSTLLGVPAFDLPGAVRRIRRAADLSQREFAQHLGLSKSMVAAIETGDRGLDARSLARAAGLAGLRLALLDEHGEVGGMASEAVRDLGGRRFPAHLDTRYADEGWWHDAHHWTRPQAWYTFDLDRERRDGRRRRAGTPGDHQLPQPGDSPRDRARTRWERAEQRRREELQRRFHAGELRDVGPDLVCTCPPECAELDLGERPVHAVACPCGCDID
jgi:HTH-type transcriptional regulator/antitoxin HipB